MNKSELIKKMSDKLDQLSSRDVDLAIHTLLEIMSESLADGGRIEIRGFGTFSNHFRKPRTVRNPKTGEVGIHKPGKFVPHFKPGKDLRKRVDASCSYSVGGRVYGRFGSHANKFASTI